MTQPFLKSSHQGYICIDHSESPGFDGRTAELGARLSLQRFIGAGKKFESVTNCCSHCDRQVVRNPDRTRPRGHCSQCDLFVCDPCQADLYLTSECRCKAKRHNAIITQALKGTA